MLMRHPSLTMALVLASVVAVADEPASLTTVPASLYVQKGLVLHYDGIENAGAGVHDDAVKAWKNLAGAADGTYDVTLPSWVTVGSNWMYSATIPRKGNSDAIDKSKSGAYPTISSVEGITAATPVIAMEIVMVRDADWAYTDNYHNTQVPFGTTRGNICYRGNGAAETNDFCIVYPISSTRTQMMFWRPNADARQVHTLSVNLGTSAATCKRWFDAVPYMGSWGADYESNWPSTYRFFSNTRVGIRIHAIRLYNRALTDEEVALHCKLDRARFLGEVPDDALRFVVQDIAPQTLNGAEDACPDPVVWDVVPNRRLVRGVDYRLSFYENDRPGSGYVVVNGLGDYEGQRVRKTFAISHGFTATISSEGTAAVVSFPAADTARALYAAWGETDGGPLTNGWPTANFAQVATVPAGATSAEVTLPAGATAAAALRFFLDHEATPRAYVTDGLRALYDGVYNGGTVAEPVHDPDATNWLDLSGNANSVWLPEYVTVQSNALFSAVRTDPGTHSPTNSKAGTFPSFPSLNGLPAQPYELTLEVLTRRADKWTFEDIRGNMQTLVYTPLGYVSYRNFGDREYGVCYLHWSDSAWAFAATYNTWQHETADVRTPHTVSARLSTQRENASFLMDGIRDTGATVLEPWQEGALSGYRFFLNPRVGITAYAARIYTRRLSDREMMRNATIDAARYRGGNGKILAASDLVRSGRLASKTRRGGVTVRVAAAPCARRVYAAWGASDCGAESNAWPNVAYVTTIPAGATEVTSVELPTEAQRSQFGRLFLVDVYDSTSYVTNGLAAHWDGIDNVLVDGERRHDAETRTWHDLTGGGANVTLPDYVTVEANACYSTNHVGKGSASNTVQGVSRSSTELTLETVSRHCGWQKTDEYGNLQSSCSTPLGSIGYRDNAVNGFYYFQPAVENKNDLYNWRSEDGKVGDVNTLSIQQKLFGSEVYLNARRDSDQARDGYQSDRSSDYCYLFSAPRIALRTYCVRIYTRLLSKEELVWNSGVDDVRFRGKPAPMRASDLVDFREKGSIVIFR